jgi:hypothetical protein
LLINILDDGEDSLSVDCEVGDAGLDMIASGPTIPQAPTWSKSEKDLPGPASAAADASNITRSGRFKKE